MALLQRGDEVILFEPYYGYHVSTILAVEAVPIFVSLQRPDWSLSIDDLEQSITNRTKAIVVNSPGNPSGKLLTRPRKNGKRTCDIPFRKDWCGRSAR